MPTVYEGFGVEEITDDIEIVLTAGLNDMIAYEQDRLALRDETRATRRGLAYEPLTVEPIADGNWYVGSLPSFIRQTERGEHFPLVAIVPGRLAPAPEDAQSDHLDVFQNFVSIHAICKAGPVPEVPDPTQPDPFEVAFRRAARTAEAIYRLVKTDRALRRKLAGNSAPMNGLISEPWIFPYSDGHGDDWCWVAVGTEYTVKNYSLSEEV